MKRLLNDIAVALDLPLDMLERWIRQGRIPICKSGRNGIFDETVLKNWAAAHNLRFSAANTADRRTDEAMPDNLCPAIERGGIFYDVEGEAVADVLRHAVEKLAGLTDPGRETLYEKLVARETLMSTGIGRGVAIPHPRDPIEGTFEKPVIAVCFLKHPVDFNAVDDAPVFMLFLLLSPTTKIHLHLLSRLSFCIRDHTFAAFLRTVPTPETLLEKIADFEARLDSGES